MKVHLFIPVLVFLSISCKSAGPQGTNKAISMDSASRAFFQCPNDQTWQALTATRPDSCFGHFAIISQHIERYSTARLQRDLPNSMSRDGHIYEYLEKHNEIMQRELAIINGFPQEDAWRIITILCTREFSEDISWAAIEIGYRMSAARLMSLESFASKPKREMIETVCDRFASGHGRIGDW
jgi:hypothetical protein